MRWTDWRCWGNSWHLSPSVINVGRNGKEIQKQRKNNQGRPWHEEHILIDVFNSVLYHTRTSLIDLLFLFDNHLRSIEKKLNNYGAPLSWTAIVEATTTQIWSPLCEQMPCYCVSQMPMQTANTSCFSRSCKLFIHCSSDGFPNQITNNQRDIESRLS